MTARRAWVGLVVLALVAVGIYLVALNWGGAPAESSSEVAASATAQTPAQAGSTAAPSSSQADQRTVVAAAPPRTENGFPVTKNGTVAVPARYQFAGVERVQTGRDFEDWMSRFPQADQKMLRGYDKRFYGVYQGRTAQDIAWMAAHGYPMPEDVLAAKFMSTADLRAMAQKGNLKAAFLLQDRDLTEISQKAPGQNWMEDPQLTHDSFILFDKVIGDSNSPYKAYLEARSAPVFYHDPVSVDAQVIGALYWARSLGDLGAKRRIDSFARSSRDPSQRQQRLAMVAAAASTSSYWSRNLAKLPRKGCIDLIGARGADNPTGHFDQ